MQSARCAGGRAFIPLLFTLCSPDIYHFYEGGRANRGARVEVEEDEGEGIRATKYEQVVRHETTRNARARARSGAKYWK